MMNVLGEYCLTSAFKYFLNAESFVFNLYLFVLRIYTPSNLKNRYVIQRYGLGCTID